MFRRTLDEARSLPLPAAGRKLLPGTSATGPAPVWSSWSGAYTPAVECLTRDRNLVVRAELPGIDPNDIVINVSGDQLTISGEKKLSRESEEGSVYFQEVEHGRFERSFTLPEGVKTDQVKATYASGVLEITMPAEGLPTPRRVPIEVAENSKAIKAA